MPTPRPPIPPRFDRDRDRPFSGDSTREMRARELTEKGLVVNGNARSRRSRQIAAIPHTGQYRFPRVQHPCQCTCRYINHPGIQQRILHPPKRISILGDRPSVHVHEAPCLSRTRERERENGLGSRVMRVSLFRFPLRVPRFAVRKKIPADGNFADAAGRR